jgi:threonine/homoserine/homoserine lactone efflux protein
MGDRLKIFGLVALLGFMAGIIADLTSTYVIPWLMTVLPVFIKERIILSGLAGACLTVVLVSIWAYITGPSEP